MPPTTVIVDGLLDPGVLSGVHMQSSMGTSFKNRRLFFNHRGTVRELAHILYETIKCIGGVRGVELLNSRMDYRSCPSSAYKAVTVCIRLQCKVP